MYISVVKEISNNPPLPMFRMHILSKLKYMTNVNTINLDSLENSAKNNRCQYEAPGNKL